MDFDDVSFLRANSPAWRLLRADSSPLVLWFLGDVFVQQNSPAAPGSRSRREARRRTPCRELTRGQVSPGSSGLPRCMGGAGARMASEVLPGWVQ